MSDIEERGDRMDDFCGLAVRIEIEAGQTKSGVGEDGQPWERVYELPYGELADTLAQSDGDPVDIYLGPSRDPRLLVYVVHQLKRDGSYDEDKVMLGFQDPMSAMLAYQRHGPPWGFGTMDAMTLDEFKNGYLASNRSHASVAPDTASGREAVGQARYGS